MVIAKREVQIKSGGICAGCACHFESRNFYKIILNLMRVKYAIYLQYKCDYKKGCDIHLWSS